MNRLPVSVVALTGLLLLVACDGAKPTKGGPSGSGGGDGGGKGGTTSNGTGGSAGGGGSGLGGAAGVHGSGGLGGAGGVAGVGGGGGVHGSGGGAGGAGAGGAGGTATGGQGGRSVPVRHRAAAPTCVPDRPAGSCTYPDGGPTANACTSDSACPSSTGLSNGRCGPAPRVNICQCTYDTCFRDEDCTLGGPCACRTSDTAGTTAPNGCMNGNCRVDADCGGGGWCSPTYDFSCGSFFGFIGYYCHTPSDACLNDSDCGTASPAATCRYNPEVGAWACASGQCAG